MDQQEISIISFGLVRKDLSEQIALYVRKEFGLPVSLSEGHLDLSEYYDPSRRQYNGNKLLQKIKEDFGSHHSKTIGLFSVDLFIPILTYIFGQAMLGGDTAIASWYRLSNENYGIKKDDKLLAERFRKEVIHELGHTFGLIHCHHPDCVMRSSTYAEDIDQKTENFCINCRVILNSLLPPGNP